jgi:hypothetical protein
MGMTKREIVTHLVAGIDRETFLAMVHECLRHNRNKQKQKTIEEYVVSEYCKVADEIYKQTR